jgi:hypothetical protein
MKTAVIATIAAACASSTVAFAPTTAFQGAPVAQRVAAASSVRMQATGAGKSLEYNPDKYSDKNSANYRRLSDSLNVSLQRIHHVQRAVFLLHSCSCVICRMVSMLLNKHNMYSRCQPIAPAAVQRAGFASAFMFFDVPVVFWALLCCLRAAAS